MLIEETLDELSKICYQGQKFDRCHNRNAIRFTYIAKDRESNVYKIGRTVNLRKRILAIRTSPYFENRDYYLIAFTPCDIEEYVQNAIISAGGVPPERRSSVGVIPKELFSLSESDIELVIDCFKFHRVENGMIPTVERSENGEYESLFCRYNIISFENPRKKPIRRLKTKRT